MLQPVLFSSYSQSGMIVSSDSQLLLTRISMTRGWETPRSFFQSGSIAGSEGYGL